MTIPTVHLQEVSDPLEEMLKKTGCLEKHYKVLECFSDTKDWRKCQEEVKEFRKCMDLYNSKKLEDSTVK